MIISTVNNALSKIQALLEKEGMLEDLVYVEKTQSGEYSPTSGDTSSVDVTHNFQGIITSTGSSITKGMDRLVYPGFSTLKEVVVFIKGLTFMPKINHSYELLNKDWSVVDFNENPLNSTYELVLGK